MTDQDRKGNMTLSELLAGGMKPGADLGPADPQTEGTYRRGYHHCAVDIAHFIEQNGPITAEMLHAWVEGPAMNWRKKVSRDRKIIAPGFLPDSAE